MEACLIDCINSSLKLYMFRNATFLCERLYAEYPSESNLHLLATCYFRSNQPYRVYHVLKGTKVMQSRYLFALACFEMGNLAEAETALLPASEPGTEVPNGAAGYYMLGLICRYTDRRQAAISHYTLALSLDPFFWSAYEELCMLGAEEDAAALYGDLAVLHLQRQQLQWEFQCQHLSQGDIVDSSSIFQNSSRSPLLNDGSPRQTKSMAISDIGTTVGISTTSIGSGVHSPIAGGISPYTTPSPGPPQPSGGPPALNRPIHGVFGGTSGGSGTCSYLSSQMGDVSPRALVNAPVQPQRRKIIDESKLKKSIRAASSRAAYSQVSGRLFAEPVPRRSTRLLGDSNVGSAQQNSSGGTNLGAASSFLGGNGSGHSSSSQIGMGGSSNRGIGALRASISRKSSSGIAENNIEEGRRNGDPFDEIGSDEGGVNSGRRVAMAGTEDESLGRSRINSFSAGIPRGKRAMEGAIELLNFLRVIGEGFRHLCMYHCQEAVQTFMKLSQHQYATGWVLCQVGKAYFEMVDYVEAERAFCWARRVSPDRLDGFDVYSTVLYHMKKEVELSYLAQELVAMDRLSPQAWCVMGNCFSLQKDHEAALKYFQRAIQLDQYFTYAHTLCGHEYLAMEDFKEALSCYRNAIRIDARHYNAWYGLGTIYFRQEKFEFAEYHFRRALHINNRSSVLFCYLGMALHALKNNKDALILLEQAVVADPKNPLPRFQKANVLMSEESYDDALTELEHLKEVAARESSVFFLMGKIYKRLNMPEQAMYHFCIALDLKPSAADVNLIKTAIEKLHVPDDMEEENL